jgi:hypothetical protein
MPAYHHSVRIHAVDVAHVEDYSMHRLRITGVSLIQVGAQTAVLFFAKRARN